MGTRLGVANSLGGFLKPPTGDEARPPHPLRKGASVRLKRRWERYAHRARVYGFPQSREIICFRILLFAAPRRPKPIAFAIDRMDQRQISLGFNLAAQQPNLSR